MLSNIVISIVFSAVEVSGGAAGATAATAEHVVVVGIDGMRGESVEKTDTSNMHALMREGVWSFTAEGVMPSSSAPNWSAVLMGSDPETTGITRNEWVRGDGPLFPTILNAVHAQRPEAKIAALFEWDDFGRLFEVSDTTLLKNKSQCKEGRDSDASPSANVAAAAADAIRADKPTLTIIHLDLVDHAGHANDYGTPEYLKAVTAVDGLLGEIMGAVRDAGIADKTVIIALSDHGGINKQHGGPTPEERLAAWIASGPGIVKGKAIEAPVTLTQTSPTIARLLGVNAPDKWTAKPIEEIFAKK